MARFRIRQVRAPELLNAKAKVSPETSAAPQTLCAESQVGDDDKGLERRVKREHQSCRSSGRKVDLKPSASNNPEALSPTRAMHAMLIRIRDTQTMQRLVQFQARLSLLSSCFVQLTMQHSISCIANLLSESAKVPSRFSRVQPHCNNRIALE